MAQRIKLIFETVAGNSYSCVLTPTEEGLQTHDNDIKQYLDFVVESCWRSNNEIHTIYGDAGVFSIDMNEVEVIVGMLVDE